MFCPVCRDEYREGYDLCSDCGVPLVEDLPPEPEPAARELVTVLETGSQSLVAVAASVLDSARIPYVARNERLQNLFGAGSIGAGYNVLMGPVRLEVPRDREEEARILLTQMPIPVEDEDEGGDGT